MKFHLHPEPDRLFEVLSASLETGPWTSLQIAVAWARESAVRQLTPVLKQLLETGGSLRITVGVALQGTPTEALEALLALEAFGNAATFVYHNEASEETFHPKIYLLASPDQARIIVGSSNLTDGGLATNVEAAIDLEVPIDAPIVVEVLRCLEGLTDTRDLRVKRLDSTFLSELVASGYVVSEAELRTRRAAQTRQRRQRGPAKPRLFGTVRRARLARRQGFAAPVVETQVLLLRPRRASESARRTQVQVPIRLMRTPFFAGVAEVVSAHDNRAHGLIRATARGGLNTVKVELPEIGAIDDPVIRLTRRGTRVAYEAFSSASDLGQPIFDALQTGLESSPPTTVATVADQTRATLYRFI